MTFLQNSEMGAAFAFLYLMPKGLYVQMSRKATRYAFTQYSEAKESRIPTTTHNLKMILNGFNQIKLGRVGKTSHSRYPNCSMLVLAKY
jgi:hypothetical protein